MEKGVRWVVSREGRKWVVTREGATRPQALFDDRESALARAHEAARRRPAQIVVKDETGVVLEIIDVSVTPRVRRDMAPSSRR